MFRTTFAHSLGIIGLATILVKRTLVGRSKMSDSDQSGHRLADHV
jgi:hypothetical protein